MRDFGYDISNYTDIDPLFGSLSDFDDLLKAAHEQGQKIILDLVPNHTSDQHPWFQESRSSRENPKRDWYIWKDPGPGGREPNNWRSEFGGSAWAYDAQSGQYYYHAFLASQPDLNWRNPAVREAMYDAMRFWLRRGVDGFRIDVLWHLIKDRDFRDNPPNPAFVPSHPPHQAVMPLYTTDQPEIHDVIQELRSVANEFPERLLIGEIYLPLDRLVSYYGRDLDGVHLPFNFSLLFAPWQPPVIGKLIEEYEAALPPGGWPNWVLGNHDQPRIASRVGASQARLAAMLLLTLRGTPTIYYGDEVGMQQVALSRDQVRDPFELNVPGIGVGRDGCRTPMQWEASRHAGFSEITPWLPVAPDCDIRNVECQKRDPNSVYHLYRNLISLRRSHPALHAGSYRKMLVTETLLVYARESEGEKIIVALNFSDTRQTVKLNSEIGDMNVLISTRSSNEPRIKAQFSLGENEGVVAAAI
jgi:alpha-glucosidase